MNFIKYLSLTVFSLSIFLGCSENDAPDPTTHQADVIIYGGTSAAIIAAVQVMKMGKSVIVVSPDQHLGGLSAGGLGWTDSGNKEVIGGLSREFYHRIYMKYQDPQNWKWQASSEYGNRGQGTVAMDGENRTMWIFEPHIAEEVYEDFVAEYDIEIYRDEWLNRENGVTVEDTKITQFSTLNGLTFRGQAFIDASYEGDLMAAAGVSYMIGREANSRYGEQWNGVQTNVFHHGHYFKSDIDPYILPSEPKSGLLPFISDDPPGAYGSGDNRLQAYCFRMCLSSHPDNRVPFEAPEGYNSDDYELLRRVFASGWRETFSKFDPIPNRKTDTNNHGPFSTDFIGMNYGYPEADYKTRQEIIREHENYQKGLMFFLNNDPGVPEEVRFEMQKWGLAKDEFIDHGHWPHQIYVREARRMIGHFVMTEHEVLGHKPVIDPVGMGSYTMDSHNVQRYVTARGFVQNEGDVGVHPETPYQISFQSLLPKKEEIRNLTVPVCLSSSHIAYGSIRMEPVFMILGQSAATAVVLALEKNLDIQDLNYQDLRDQLLQDQQVLSWKKPVKN